MTEIKNIKDQALAIEYFIGKMDIEMIDAFLDNDKTYQDWVKIKFIYKLNLVFERFKKIGDTHLTSYSGFCKICDKSKTGFTFVGNISRNYMSIIFDIRDGKIEDLYECSVFGNNVQLLDLREKIYIDDEPSLPF